MGMKEAIQPLRVGFLGTGYIADWHAKALSTIPGVSLVAVCDKDLSRAQAFGHPNMVSPDRTSRWMRCSKTGNSLSTQFTFSCLPTSMPARHLP